MTHPQQRFHLLDTRSIWGPSNPSTSNSPPTALSTTAPHALALLPTPEQQKATRFHFLRDAKLSLASSLLKRHFISTCIPRAPFQTLQLTRRGDAQHGKPAYVPADADLDLDVDFNVSHQAGLVALAGYVRPKPHHHSHSQTTTTTTDPAVTLGVDITHSSERRAQDHRFIARDGFDQWIDMHADVFSPADLTAMKFVEMDEFGNREDDLDSRRRKFYTYWCLKEAYVKLEGEALLAGWLKEVEFRNVRVPTPGRGEGVWGEHVCGIEVWRGGMKEKETRMELWAWGPDFMVGLATKGDEECWLTGEWEVVDGEGLVEEARRNIGA